jgi:alpha-ketoglutarate-dependent 2,4-dichlorophenoxyacetate dioxygenase
VDVQPLHERFGVRVSGVDLAAVAHDPAGADSAAWRAIRELFERHSLLLFPGQALDDDAHLTINGFFGPIEVRSKDDPKPAPTVSRVSNVLPDGRVMPPDALRLKDLQANMLWHTDSTFLPWPALVNVLRAEVAPTEGGQSEWVSTRAAFADMPDDMKTTLRGAVVLHRYSHSRAKIGADVAAADHIAMWPDTAWRAVWPNPVTGDEAVYIASHAYGIRGWDEAEAQAFIDAVIAFCTQPRYVYTHTYTPGDVMMWDERATLHRGMPWDFAQPRTLCSACSSATEADGLKDVTPAAA